MVAWRLTGPQSMNARRVQLRFPRHEAQGRTRTQRWSPIARPPSSLSVHFCLALMAAGNDTTTTLLIQVIRTISDDPRVYPCGQLGAVHVSCLPLAMLYLIDYTLGLFR